MKYVIDIPEKYYKVIREIPVETYTADMLIIANGKPLDAVLDEIKEEIEQEIAYKPMEMWDFRRGLTRAFEIIDKYRAEGSEKE